MPFYDPTLPTPPSVCPLCILYSAAPKRQNQQISLIYLDKYISIIVAAATLEFTSKKEVLLWHIQDKHVKVNQRENADKTNNKGKEHAACNMEAEAKAKEDFEATVATNASAIDALKAEVEESITKLEITIKQDQSNSTLIDRLNAVQDTTASNESRIYRTCKQYPSPIERARAEEGQTELQWHFKPEDHRTGQR